MNITTAKGEKMWLGEFSALVQRITKDKEGNTILEEPTYGAGTLFRDAAKNLQLIEAGKVYKTTFSFKEGENGYVLSSDKANFTEAKYKFPNTFKTYFNDTLKNRNIDITLGDIDLNKSKDPTDIRVLTVTAFDYDTGKTADGREFGYYDVMDDSISGNNFRIFLNPVDIKYEKGSLLNIGIRIDTDKKEEIRTSPHFIVPTELAEVRDLTTTTVENTETVDISSEESSEESANDDEVSFEI
jgi:hypothetical protein